MDFNYHDIEKSFIEAMESCGLSPAAGEQLRMDGHKHRMRLAGDKGRATSGEYCIYADESPAGWFKSYRASHGVPYETWSYKSETFSSMSPEERKAFIDKKEAERAERERQDARERQRSILVAREKWNNATQAHPLHNYIMKKGLRSAHGARLLGNNLVIPYVNSAGEVQTIQTISGTGEKLFQLNAPKAGFYSILDGDLGALTPEPTGNTWICEGWATGCSIREATGDIVIVAADCGNLYPVAKNVMESNPSWDLCIAADNDSYKGRGNPGVAAAIKIFEELGIPFVAPDFKETEELSDWNDYACTRGLDKTRCEMLRKLEIIKGSSDYEARNSYPKFTKVNDKTGKPLGVKENFEILMKFNKYNIKYDEIKKEISIDIPGANFSTDHSLNAALDGPITSTCVEYGFPVSLMPGYVNWLASKNVINPVQDWIQSRKWDGKNRIAEICSYLEAEDGFPPFLRDILVRRWLVSGVAAAFAGDGFRTRGTLVLQGAQGIGKTTFFKSLAGDDNWFAEGVTLDPSDKDSVKRCISNWIIELGELEATFKKADLAKLKSFLTSSRDEIRLPWAKKISPYQRRCIFCATVNDYQFLIDRTGNSRWWVIPLKHLRRIPQDFDVQQLWAEVYQEYYMSTDADRRQWWLTSEEDQLLEAQNKPFEILNYVELLIEEGLDWDAPKDFWTEMSAMQVLEACGIDRDKQSSLVARAGQVLKKKTGSDPVRIGKACSRHYLVPPKASVVTNIYSIK